MARSLPFRWAPSRRVAWLTALDVLFRLPSRLLARAAGTARRTRAAALGLLPANDNVGAFSANAANSNIPRRLA